MFCLELYYLSLSQALRRFRVVDANNDGVISSSEALAFIGKLAIGLTNELVLEEFEALDIDDSGDLDLAEVSDYLVPDTQTLDETLLHHMVIFQSPCRRRSIWPLPCPLAR